jgi:hypothetical protein
MRLPALFAPAGSPGASARRRWVGAALLPLALLVVSFVVWIALPSPTAPSPPPPAVARTREPAPAATSTARPPPAAARPGGAIAAGGVEGEVQDPQGNPVANALVTCATDGRELEATTDDAGRFRLGPEADGCKAVATKQGFGASGEEALLARTVNRLRLSAPTGIAGNVVDEAGAPVMTYVLAVASFEPSSGAVDGGAAPDFKAHIDDAEGAFERTDLAPGRYVLAVSVPRGPMATGPSVDVKPGAMTAGVRIVVHPGTTVVGTVTDAASGAPIEDAKVIALLGGMSTRPSASPGGAFKVEGAPAAGFDLVVLRAGYVENVTRGLSAPAGGGPLRVDVALQKRAPPVDR